MKKLLEFLWSGCWHEWEIESTCKVFDDTTENILTGKSVPVYRKYNLRCKKCGEMKTIKS